jgi:integrase/recombinase XerD
MVLPYQNRRLLPVIHDLRHSVATRMVESGASIVAVSGILGHSDLKTTMSYTHPENAVKDALENLANLRQTTTNIATSENAVN